MINKTPLLTVILPVYNCEKYVALAINSILQQSFQDFELIVINDGSTDNSWVEIQKFKDSRIRSINQENMGIAKSLNKGLDIAQGQFIARQDSDDLSDPDRFLLQIAFLKKNPKIDLVGTWANILERENSCSRKLIHPTKVNDIKAFLCFDNPFVHTSVIFRKKTILGLGGYFSEAEYQPEDYDLWSRLAKNSKLANLPQILVQYRELPLSLSKIKSIPFPAIDQISFRHLKYYFSFIPDKWAQDFCSFIHFNRLPNKKTNFILKCIFIYMLIVIRFRPLEKPTWKKILGSFKRLLRSTFF